MPSVYYNISSMFKISEKLKTLKVNYKNENSPGG